jgi:hypothetical protein
MAKVERKPAEFEPIVITLCSQKEATDMWHRLNCLPGTSLMEYMEAEGLEYKKDRRALSLWEKFNRVFTPDSHKRTIKKTIGRE